MEFSKTDTPGIYLFGDTVAIRYGDDEGNWDPSAPARIANFILGHDVETRTTTLNESMLDVVIPVKHYWNPESNVADLELNVGGRVLGISLGQWLTRDRMKRLRVVSHNHMIAQHFPPPEPKTFREDLTELLDKHNFDKVHQTPSTLLADYMANHLQVMGRFLITRDHAAARANRRVGD